MKEETKTMGPNERKTYSCSFDGVYHSEFEYKMHDTVNHVVTSLQDKLQKISEQSEKLGIELKYVEKKTEEVFSKVLKELVNVKYGQQDMSKIF